MHPPRPAHLEELEFDGNDISFFDDLEALPRIWQTQNQENVGQLLIDFFRYFTKDFMYNQDVVSIRSEKGTLSKEMKGWFTDVSLRVSAGAGCPGADRVPHLRSTTIPMSSFGTSTSYV